MIHGLTEVRPEKLGRHAPHGSLVVRPHRAFPSRTLWPFPEIQG